MVRNTERPLRSLNVRNQGFKFVSLESDYITQTCEFRVDQWAACRFMSGWTSIPVGTEAGAGAAAVVRWAGSGRPRPA